MRLIVADTSPVFYLLSIEHLDILPRLFGKVFIPDAVHAELCHPAAPHAIREWAASLPGWIEVVRTPVINDAALAALGRGERAAIALAESMQADLILIDERKGTHIALGKGLSATGTLGVLDLAARRGLINLAEAFARLKTTNFRYRQEIMDALLQLHNAGGNG